MIRTVFSCLTILAFWGSPQIGFAKQHLSCEDVLSNDTFKDALTRNDGRGFPVYAHDKEGHQLIGLECEKRVLD